MKKLLIALFVALVALFSIETFATSLHPDTFKLEAVTITNVDTVHNLMPVLPPGGRKPYTILTVDVMSNGCTDAEDFAVRVVNQGSKQVVSIHRTEPDYCRAMPRVDSVQLRTEKITGKNLHVANPLLVQIQTVH